MRLSKKDKLSGLSTQHSKLGADLGSFHVDTTARKELNCEPLFQSNSENLSLDTLPLP